MGLTTNGWQRCRIIRLHENGTCDALLIDTGIIERIDWYDLRTMDGTFRPAGIRCSISDFPPLAIPCSLVDVVTAKRIQRVSLGLNEDFQGILQHPHDFYVYTHRADAVSDIFLYYKFAGEFYCINNLFPTDLSSDENSSDISVVPTKGTTSPMGSTSKTTQSEAVNEAKEVILSHGFDKSDNGSHKSDEMEPNLGDQETTRPNGLIQISKPESVVIRNVVGIDEIYFCYARYLGAFDRLSFEIQKSMATRTDEEKKLKPAVWAVNSDCLVINPHSKIQEWARGRIVMFSGATTCLVYLRDHGKTIECGLGELEPIAKKFYIIRDFTWKVQLSNITMKEGGSSEAVNRLLCDLIDEDMAISTVDNETNKGCSIILWAIKTVSRALQPDKITYININEVDLIETTVK